MAKRFILKKTPGRESWQHDRDCLYVVTDGPAPCTCPAGYADDVIEIDTVTRTSFVLDGTCPTCERLAKGELAPPHDASPRCESGKRTHCTCDICF